jgi:hypothetical protein
MEDKAVVVMHWLDVMKVFFILNGLYNSFLSRRDHDSNNGHYNPFNTLPRACMQFTYTKRSFIESQTATPSFIWLISKYRIHISALPFLFPCLVGKVDPKKKFGLLQHDAYILPSTTTTNKHSSNVSSTESSSIYTTLTTQKKTKPRKRKRKRRKEKKIY